MKQHGLTPDDLHNQSEFELIDTIAYTDLKSFIIKEIRQKSLLIKLFSIAQVVAIVVLTAVTCFYIFGFTFKGLFRNELVTIGIALLVSFTLLIAVHELIHAAAFRLLGKKDVGFGVQWGKFLFYAESNREVLNRREMTVVALAPFLVISITGFIAYFLIPVMSLSLGGLVVSLVHFFFCGGDFAIISYLNRQKPSDIYTYDDRSEKRTYYFRKR